MFGLTYIPVHYFTGMDEPSEVFAARRAYVDMIKESGDYVGFASIPSKLISSSYLDITIPYGGYFEDIVFSFESSLKQKESTSGYRNKVFDYLNWEFGTHLPSDKENLKYLNKLENIMVFKIDQIKIPSELCIARNKNSDLELKQIIDLSSFKRGKHVLSIELQKRFGDSLETEDYVTIPFWYYPTQTSSQEIQVNTPITESLP